MVKAARINRRIVNTKSHTIGYVITGGREITRNQAVLMANKGEISGVSVISGPNGRYIQSTGRRLYDLPVVRKNSVNGKALQSSKS